MLSVWCIEITIVLLGLIVIYVIGYGIIRLLGIPKSLSLALGPSVFMLEVGIASYTLAKFGLSWSWSTFLPFIGAIFAVVILLRLIVTHKIEQLNIELYKNRKKNFFGYMWITVGGGILATVLTIFPFWIAVGNPLLPNQSWDSVFHLSALRDVITTYNASPYGSLSQAYGLAEHNAFYPTLIYALLALLAPFAKLLGAGVFPTVPSAQASEITSVLSADNVLSVLLLNAGAIILVFLWMQAAGSTIYIILQSQLVKGDTYANRMPVFNNISVSFSYRVATFAMFFAASLVAVPMVQLSALALWPYVLAEVLWIGTLGPLLFMMKIYFPHLLGYKKQTISKSSDYLKPKTTVEMKIIWVVLGLGMLGTVLAHPSALFAYLLLLLVCAGVFVSTKLKNSTRKQKICWIVSLGIFSIILLVILGITYYLSATFRSVINYQRVIKQWPFVTVGQLISDYPMTHHYTYAALFGIVLFGLVIVGMRYQKNKYPQVIDRTVRQILMGLALAALVLVACASSSLGWLRVFSAPWYSQASRVVFIFWVAVLPFGAFGFLYIHDKIRALLIRISSVEYRFFTSALAGFLIILLTIGLSRPGTRAALAQGSYEANKISYGQLVSSSEIIQQKQMSRMLDRDKRVIADPFSGAPFLYSYFSVPVFYPHLGAIGTDNAHSFLAKNLFRLGTDPQVCKLLQQEKIGYFYIDTASYPTALTSNSTETIFNKENLPGRPRQADNAPGITKFFIKLYTLVAKDGIQVGEDIQIAPTVTIKLIFAKSNWQIWELVTCH